MRFAFAPLLLLSISLGGCFGVVSPTLTVVEIRPETATPEGRRFVVVVDAENRSENALPLKDATYTLSIDGKKVFEGQRSPESTLRKFATQRLLFPVSVPNGVLASSGTASYRVSGSVVYLPPGKFNEILYDYRLIRPTTGFSGSGQLDLGASAASDRGQGIDIALRDQAAAAGQQ
ncbi:MAG: LEA type 2 family protein [Phycisphaerales bacterium]|nr:LEA type 2 family protein [Phycisphaerales bacterium]